MDFGAQFANNFFVIDKNNQSYQQWKSSQWGELEIGVVYNEVNVTSKNLAIDLVNHTPQKLIAIITHLFCQIMMTKRQLS